MWKITGSTTDESLIAKYPVYIEAKLANYPLEPVETSHVFEIAVDYPDPCDPLLCTINNLFPLDED